ncbi:MAG: DDE-type integrase/transposase/recombinase [Jatrophihabitans sp.]
MISEPDDQHLKSVRCCDHRENPSYLYRAADQHGQVIDVLVSTRRDAAARNFFTRAVRVGPRPVEVTTDRVSVHLPARDRRPRLCGASRHRAVGERSRGSQPRSAQRVATADAGAKRLASARTVASGHAFVQNLRRGQHQLTADLAVHHRIRVAFDELASCL